ncbi:hypothetical protein ZIOFF_068118 [Zingiber officinale]|uniref:Mon2/Sec7/BIG1-like HDS domain-containing protein n=1 Tax=Zingiber officinale TaxID=94328 RepID=A0A8J5CGK5_ZINOF|nr:hypothetical protein ZIOFF_068118 [Zingiber officinale]
MDFDWFSSGKGFDCSSWRCFDLLLLFRLKVTAWFAYVTQNCLTVISDVFTVNGGREVRPIGAFELAKAVQELGAGEILLNCIDCDGWGTNEKTLINILAHRNATQRKQIQLAYEELYNESLTKKLESELKGNFEFTNLKYSRVEIDEVRLSENLLVAIFVMDSLRQLAMKFLEREELANYNFQNEFLKPFVVIMQKSNSSEICELIVRCVSQMVLSCVNHVKSGWKSVFMVFTTAVADDRSLHCLLTVYTWKKCTLRTGSGDDQEGDVGVRGRQEFEDGGHGGEG